MDYEQMKEMIDNLLRSGGFSSDEPLDSIARISDSAQQPTPSVDVCSYSSLLAYFGEWDRAEAVARSIKDNQGERGVALALLAQRLAEAGLNDRAETIARSNRIEISGTHALTETVTALTKIASKFAKTGQIDRASELLREAEAVVSQREHSDHIQASFLDDIAEVWRLLNQREQALRVWAQAIATARQSIEIYRAGGAPDIDSWKTLSSIAQGLNSIGENEQALKALQVIDNDEWRKRVLHEITSGK